MPGFVGDQPLGGLHQAGRGRVDLPGFVLDERRCLERGPDFHQQSAKARPRGLCLDSRVRCAIGGRARGFVVAVSAQ